MAAEHGPAREETAAAVEQTLELRLQGDAPPLDAPLSQAGNRPADGARVISASEVPGEEFIGAEGASDFLGLDVEFDAALADACEGQFMQVDEALSAEFSEARGEHDPVAQVLLDSESDQGPHVPGAQPPEGELDEEHVEAAPRRRARLILATGTCALVAALAVLLVSLMGGEATSAPEPVELADVPARPEGSGPPFALQPALSPEVLAPVSSEAAVAQVGAQPAGPGSQASSAGVVEDVEPQPVAEAPVVASLTPAPRRSPELTAAESTHLLAGAPGAVSLEELLVEISDPQSFIGSNAAFVDLVWRGDRIPMDAITSLSRVLTPSVGSVRVIMASSDVFEGRLFAVGENKVWLDMELGRLGLDGRSVSRIEHITEEAAAAQIDPGSFATGKRVRARVAGGVIYGWVRSVKGSKVTLVTDSGARITLDDPVLEPASERKSVALKF